MFVLDPNPPPPPPPKKGCFPSTAKVKVANGKTVSMTDLQIGDQVQTGKDIWINFVINSF